MIVRLINKYKNVKSIKYKSIKIRLFDIKNLTIK